MMNPFEVKNAAIMVINGSRLYFVILDRPGEWTILPDTYSIEQILDENNPTRFVPERVQHRTLPLIIVPDYWLGNVSYSFQSKKRTLAETFIERKLLSEYPDLTDIRHFYEYVFFQADQREQVVFVHFLKEPKAFLLYNRLVAQDLNPYQITSPALLWQKVLKNTYADFDKGGKVLIHLLPSLAFLYFYSTGRFLFSRQIILPDSDGVSSEVFGILNYEIGQSLYLFSQQAKTEIGQFFLFSSGPESAETLSAGLEREMVSIRDRIEIKPGASEQAYELGPAGPFSTFSLSAIKEFQSVSHRTVKKIREWKPVQMMGIAVGLVLLLLLGGENLFLRKWLQNSQLQLSRAMEHEGSNRPQDLEQYNESLDFILRAAERSSVQDVIVHLAESLPDNIWVETLDVEVEPDPHVALEGVVKASGPDEFRDALSVFLDKLKTHFLGSRSLRIQEIDMEKGTDLEEPEYQTYLFKFEFGLP